MPATLHDSPLNTADTDAFSGRMLLGAVAADAPITLAGGRSGWLLRELGNSAFTALVFGEGEQADRSAHALAEADASLRVLRLPIADQNALAAQRYDAQPGTVYLLRPDQHVCARWRAPSSSAIRAALARALAKA